jgi:hypothetical protein
VPLFQFYACPEAEYFLFRELLAHLATSKSLELYVVYVSKRHPGAGGIKRAKGKEKRVIPRMDNEFFPHIVVPHPCILLCSRNEK